MVDKLCWSVGGTQLAFIVVGEVCVCHLLPNARLSVCLVKSHFLLNRIGLTVGERVTAAWLPRIATVQVRREVDILLLIRGAPVLILILCV